MNDTKTPEQYIQEIESDIITPLHSRSEPFKKAFDIYDKEKNIEKREKMRWNIWAFDLRPIHLQGAKPEEGFPSKRFGSMLGWTNKEGKKYFYPDPSQFPKEAFEYFKKKLSEVKNPIHKARYADILWDQKKDYKTALVAIDSYIECADIYFKNFSENIEELHSPLEMVDSLSTAIEIALSLSKWELVKKVYVKDLEILEKIFSINKPRWYIEIIKSILEIKDIEKNCDLSLLEKFLKHGQEEFLKQSNFHIMREFIDMEISFFKKLGKDVSEIKKLQIEVGDFFIKEAELRLTGENPSHMVAAMFYQQALEHFRNIGESSRLDILKIKIKECWQIAEQKEFKRIEARAIIKDVDIERYFAPLKKLPLNDILLYIGLDPDLRPPSKKAKESAEEQAKKFVLSSFASKLIVRNENPIRVKSDEEKLEERIIWNFVMGYDVLSAILGMIFRKLRNDFGLNRESLTDYLCSRDFLKSESKFIKCALERYFAEDYASFLHISVIRIESILRNFLITLNIPRTTERGGVVQEKTLDKILDTPGLQYILGGDVIYFIDVFLSSKQGTNLRHDIAHGLIDFEVCDELKANLIVYLWLIFATLRIEQK
jgi:hypothetical protein